MEKILVKKDSKYFRTKEEIITSIVNTYIQAYEIESTANDTAALLKKITTEILLVTLTN